MKITGCSVMPQCYAAVAEKLPEFKGLNMIVDIGNGTMNAMFLQDGRAVENKMWTELYGVRQCALKIHQILLDRFQEDIPDFGYNEKTMKMYVLGGGAKLLEHFGSFNKNRITFDFDIHANAKGYEYFCYVALRRKKNHPVR